MSTFSQHNLETELKHFLLPKSGFLTPNIKKVMMVLRCWISISPWLIVIPVRPRFKARAPIPAKSLGFVNSVRGFTSLDGWEWRANGAEYAQTSIYNYIEAENSFTVTIGTELWWISPLIWSNLPKFQKYFCLLPRLGVEGTKNIDLQEKRCGIDCKSPILISCKIWASNSKYLKSYDRSQTGGGTREFPHQLGGSRSSSFNGYKTSGDTNMTAL